MRTVILVEDSRGDVRLTPEEFREAGTSIDLHVAFDGAKGLSSLRREGNLANAPQPECILLNLNRPTMDGREVLIRLKDDANLATIPTIILTTSSSEHLYHARYYRNLRGCDSRYRSNGLRPRLKSISVLVPKRLK
jgi:CheY-like chemotaxis protein